MLDSKLENLKADGSACNRDSEDTPSKENIVLPGFSPRRETFSFATDPGRFFIYLFCLYSGFESIKEMESYIELHNDSLLNELSIVLRELEEKGLLEIQDDQVVRSATPVELDLQFGEDMGIFADMAGITIQRAFDEWAKMHRPQNTTAGFRYFVLPNNKHLIKKFNAIYNRFCMELQELASQNVDTVDNPEPYYVSLSRSTIKPEDF